MNASALRRIVIDILNDIYHLRQYDIPPDKIAIVVSKDIFESLAWYSVSFYPIQHTWQNLFCGYPLYCLKGNDTRGFIECVTTVCTFCDNGCNNKYLSGSGELYERLVAYDRTVYYRRMGEYVSGVVSAPVTDLEDFKEPSPGDTEELDAFLKDLETMVYK